MHLSLVGIWLMPVRETWECIVQSSFSLWGVNPVLSHIRDGVGIGCMRDDKMNKHCGSLERRHCVITALISHNPSIYNQPHSHSGFAPLPLSAHSLQT